MDPLAPKYPHYTPYQFSGNKVIDGVELEGLEFYYTADGRLLGQYGTSSEIRVVGDLYVNFLESHFNGSSIISDRYMSKVYTISKSFYNASAETQGLIFDQIFEDASGRSVSVLNQGMILIVRSVYKVKNIETGEIRFDAAMSRGIATDNITQQLSQVGQPNAVYLDGSNNLAIFSAYTYKTYWDWYAVLWHENKHRTGGSNFGAGAWGEFNTHYAETEQKWFVNVSARYQNDTFENMQGYLEQQKKFIINYEMNLNANSEGYTQLYYDAYLKKYNDNVKKYEDAKQKYNVEGREHVPHVSGG